MEKYLFHCQLKMKHMQSGSERVKFSTEFFAIPRINERVMFYDVSDYFLENKEEGKKLYRSTLDMDDPVSVTAKVTQIIHFDTTMCEDMRVLKGVIDANAVGLLYLDELDEEPICPTGSP